MKKRWMAAVAAALAFSVMAAAAAFAETTEENTTEIPIYGGETESVSSEASSSGPSEEEPAPEESEPEPAQTSSQQPAEEPASSSGEQPPQGESALAPDGQAEPSEPGRPEFERNPVRARVSAIITQEELGDGLFEVRTPQSVVFEAVVEEGELAGTTVGALRTLDEAGSAYARPVSPGDAVYLTLYRDGSDTVRGAFSDFCRFPGVAWAALAAAVLLLLCIPRKAGVKLLVVLAVSGGLIAWWVVPAGSFWICAATTALIALIVTAVFYGIKYRTLSAYVSTLLSLSAGGGVALGLAHLFRLTGMPDAQFFSAGVTGSPPLRLTALWVCGAMLAAAGAVLVVSNSTSAGAEPTAGALTPSLAFRQGMRRGAAAMTPVCLTLFFALVSVLVVPLALLSASGAPLGRIASDELVATALTALISALTALMLAVPLTAGFSALLLRWRVREDGSLREFHVAERIGEKEQELFGQAAEKLDEAIRTTVGDTEKTAEEIEEAETRLDEELQAEEKALEAAEKEHAAHQARKHRH